MTANSAHATDTDTGRHSLPGRLRRALHRLAATSEELEADELQTDSRSQGCQRIEGVDDREQVTVYGHLKSVSLAPLAGTPTLEAALYDGSGVITLVWLGRRTIAGIKPGANLVAHGRVSCHDQRRVIYNPRYELRV
ncbi:MAG: OB-fold nucleic acid binding domain-containing protein [Nocardioidaceae bacterium]|nr:OB-fold nucleic acid binding domain-containing protein [Nocardioidaceae bacterium]